VGDNTYKPITWNQVWNANTGELYSTLRGHATEIVCLSFNPQGNIIATGSMDNTAKLWDVDTGAGVCSIMLCADMRRDF